MSRGLTSRPCRHGVAIVYLALIISVLLGIMGLAADTAYVFWTAHQLQNAADAAALAGAAEVGFSTSQAVTNAVNAAAVNKAAGAAVQLNSSTDVQVGNYVRSTATFTANTSPYNAVKVTARRTTGSPAGPLNFVFGPVFGVTSSNVSRYAIAMNTALVHPGVVVLNPTANPAVQLTGTGSNPTKITVNGGDMVVDSNSSTGISWSGHPTISANNLYLSGNDTGANSGGVFPSGTAQLNQTPLTDPLASLPAPAKPATAGSGSPLPPGYYANGLPAGTLAGGIYWVDNGISLKGNESIDATAGCLIYLHTGGITLKGNSGISYAPMTTGTYAGIAFYEDRSNSSAIALGGTSGVSNSGILYFPKAAVSVAGTPNATGTQLICDTLSVQGNAQIIINYNSSDDPASHVAFLVQ